MRDQHDAPPREAVEAVADRVYSHAYPRDLGRTKTAEAFSNLRILPDAARWRLIAWLAKGLEPTRGMALAAHNAAPGTIFDLQAGYKQMIAAALAAAAEAGDGE